MLHFTKNLPTAVKPIQKYIKAIINIYLLSFFEKVFDTDLMAVQLNYSQVFSMRFDLTVIADHAPVKF